MKIAQDGQFYCVIGNEGYILEVFTSRENATDYIAEYERALPVTAGEREKLARKHNALFQGI